MSAQTETNDEHYYHVGPVARFGFLVIAAFVGLLTVWSLTADLAGSIVSPGVVVPEGKKKTVQHVSGGTVRQIFVQEGDLVTEGQPLIKLDEVQLRANYDILVGQYYALVAQLARARAEQEDRPDLTNPFPADDEIGRQAFKHEHEIFETRRKAHLGEIAILRDRLNQLHEEIGGNHKLRAASEKQLELLQQEISGMRELAEKGYTPRVKMLQYERAEAQLSGDIGFRKSEILKAQQRVAETESEIAQSRKKRADEVARELREVQGRLDEVEPKLRATKESLTQTTILSPIAGQVLNLNMVTLGGVIEAGKPVMDIVPAGVGIMVQAQVQPQDIDDVKPGVDARIHLTTASGRDLPPVAGKVVTVGADRQEEARTGQPYYSIQVRVEAGELEKIAPVKVLPGMAVEVYMTVEERTLFDYIASPLQRRLRHAMRER